MSARTDIVNSPADQRGKAAFRQLVAVCGGGEGAGATCGKSQQRISLYGLPNSDVFPPLDVIAKLPNAGLHATVWSRHLAAIAKEVGDVVAGLCTDLSDDNDLSPPEAERRIPDIDEAIEALVRLRGAVVARSEEQE